MTLVFCVYTSFGSGHIGYGSQPNKNTDEIDDDWMIVADSGSVVLMRRSPLRYPEFGFYYGFIEFEKDSLVGDKELSEKLLGDFKYEDDFGIVPIRWVLSIPFWLLAFILAIAATVTKRIYVRKIASFKSKNDSIQNKTNS